MSILTFEPTWYLKNPHAQTMWPTISRRRIKLELRYERVNLPDQDFIDLVWDASNVSDKKKPIVLLMHGLGGSISSPYAKGLMRACSETGRRPVFMHLRGASHEPNRLDRGYHSGETQDVAYIVQHLQQHRVPISAVGVSLSGNILLKWLGETKADNPLACAIAVSVPFELHHAVDHMSEGFAKFYQYYLLKSLRSSLTNKYQCRSAPFDLKKAQKAKNFWDFDDVVTAPLHGFADARDYYQQCSSRQYLQNITVPTLIIHAIDDPFVPAHAIPTRDELSPSTTLNLTCAGGHVGFVGGMDNNLKIGYWLEKQIPQFLQACL